ncbi:glycerol dehydratase reactivase beta/small subunit family protein [Mycobacterium botniense]|uniref:PduH protein n=1 Tax=Mycobacterium botniense TaxID=84962 RepID=A0A7I9XUY4_9MYCO|nr:glycerol dehydratase reactivase beta/small subunit family protein [Mycobacterium botniense]GFG73340.1 pduH protein [Mycobacterium botniense]
MGKKAPPEMPTIVVINRGAALILREVAAGIEEEGVPCAICDAAVDVAGAVALAYCAARLSRLQVGVGIDEDGLVCVHHVKRPAAEPVAVSVVGSDLSVARRLGHNAARVVVGVPLKADSSATQ